MPPDAVSARALHPTDPEVLQCPFPYYAELHADAASAHDEGPFGWVVPGYDDAVALSLDTRTFSSKFFGEQGTTLTGVSPEPFDDEVAALVEELHPLANALFLADPPQHTRQKRLVLKALNAERVRAMEPMIREIADELIDGFIDDRRCEFLDAFAVWLPMSTVCHTLGCERSDMRRFKVWTDHIATGLVEAIDNAQRAEVLRSVIEFQRYMLPRIQQRRERELDDLLSDLVNVDLKLEDMQDGEVIEGPRHLTDAEILSALSQILAAGNHTTTNLVGNTMVTLIRHPQVMAEVRADHSLIPNLLEESLRYEAPVQCTYRVTTGEAEVSGTQVPPGSMVAAQWGAAGRDPDVFPNPDRFDIHRPNARRHLGFGHGPHFCVGNNLARAQARIAFERLLERLDEIRLAQEPQVAAVFPFQGYEAVQLEFTPARP